MGDQAGVEDSTEDVVLADAVAGGPDDLYRREYLAMMRLAVAMVDLVTIGEEIVQDAFAEVVLRWDRLDKPGAYLRTCVVNSCRKELQRRKRTRRVPERAEETATLDASDLSVLAAVRSLPPRRRAVVVLRFYEDLTESQIAELLGIRVGTVKATLRQALAQLRKVVDHD
ncbi:MAG: sigma-70 family RNA polymerase sigma factor [Acidimicrobiales bacterium]